jgi:putative ABC transport system ATP-binding protein
MRLLRSELARQPQQLVLTALVVACCVVLFLFLWSVYQGAYTGCLTYLRSVDADLWVLQNTAYNLLRGSSILPASHIRLVRETPGVGRVTPLLIILTSVETARGYWTIFLTGYDPAQGIGGPPALAAGRGVGGDDEIVLDTAFARKFGFRIGDRVVVNGKPLVVVGLSAGTNAIVIQYAFVTMRCAQSMLPFPGLVTAVAVSVAAGEDVAAVRARLDALHPNSHCFTRAGLIANNIAEMSNGFLPILGVVTVMGAIVLTAILGLLTVLSVLRRRRDYTILRMIGSSSGFLWGLIARRVGLQVAVGAATGVALFALVTPIVRAASPEIECLLVPWQVIAAVTTAFGAGAIAAAIAAARLRTDYEAVGLARDLGGRSAAARAATAASRRGRPPAQSPLVGAGEPLVTLRGVSRTYPAPRGAAAPRPALRDVDCDLAPGTATLVMGPSGSGKTTLLTVAAALQRPSAGTVRLFGRDVFAWTPREMQKLRATHIAFVFQAFLLVETMTIEDNVRVACRFAGMGGREAARRAADALARLGLAECAHRYPDQASHGEQQRAVIARAMVTGARLVVADEPTASLDAEQGAAVMGALRQMVDERGACLLVASHDVRLSRWADRVLRLDDGALA